MPAVSHPGEPPPGARADLADLGLDEGGHLLVDRALAVLNPGERLAVTGSHPALKVHLAAWCRAQGHQAALTEAPDGDGPAAVIVKGTAADRRWQGAERAGAAAGPPAPRASRAWGPAARGALVEAGGPPIGAHWSERNHVWADIAPQLYAAAAASQWDPATAVDWTAPHPAVPPEIERAVVQLMTYLVENEQAALIIPARLLSQLHPHYREVMQLLASQAADEARHVAFGVAHTAHLARADRHYLGTLRQAVERRHSALQDTAGLNAEVFDALVVLAAGSWAPEAIRRGWQAVRDLQARMDEGRQRRLAYIGFPADEAAELSALHTRNFM